MMKCTIPLVLLALALAACGDEVDAPDPASPPETTQGIPDADISLFKGSVFDDPTPPSVVWNDSMPGSNERLDPLFQGAPPRVPHGISDFLPITQDENGCVECHLSDDPDEQAPQLPDSHKTDLRNAPEKVGEGIEGSRWVCVLCHVPLSDAKPLPDGAP